MENYTEQKARKAAEYLKDLFHDYGQLNKGEECVNKDGIKYRYDLQVIDKPTDGISHAFVKAARLNGARFAKDGFTLGSGKEKIGFGMKIGCNKGDKPYRLIMHYLTILE